MNCWSKLLEVRCVVPPTCFLYFLEVFVRQELLDLTTNNSVLFFLSSRERVRVFSAEYSSDLEDHDVELVCVDNMHPSRNVQVSGPLL